MAFFEHTDLKISITRVWGRTYPTPVYNSSSPRQENFASNISAYEMILFPASNHIIHYNGITKHINDSTIVFLPHPMTDIVNPPTKEYKVESFLDTGHIALQFTCDTPLATQIETYSCGHFEKDIIMYFEKLRKLWTLKPVAYNSLALSYLYQIFATIEKKASSTYLPKNQYDLIEPSINYIDENYLSSNIDCDELAKMCNISTSYYNRIFKKRFGSSPKQYILAKKLDYATDLLTTTNLSVTSISEISGFSSLYYFSKIFKTYYGLSPQNYKETYAMKV